MRSPEDLEGMLNILNKFTIGSNNGVQPELWEFVESYEWEDGIYEEFEIDYLPEMYEEVDSFSKYRSLPYISNDLPGYFRGTNF